MYSTFIFLYVYMYIYKRIRFVFLSIHIYPHVFHLFHYLIRVSANHRALPTTKFKQNTKKGNQIHNTHTLHAHVTRTRTIAN